MQFVLELLGRAFKSLLASMGTTSLAVVVGFILVPFIVLFLRAQRKGFSALMQHWRENLQDGAMAIGIVWVVLFAWHLFYKVPHEISVQANSARLPPVSVPPAPSFGYEKTVPPLHASRTASISFTAQKIVTFIHNLNTRAPQITCFDSHGKSIETWDGWT